MTLGHHPTTAYLISGLLHAAVLCAALRVPAPWSSPRSTLISGRVSTDSIARPASIAAHWTNPEDTDEPALESLQVAIVPSPELPATRPIRFQTTATAVQELRLPEWSVPPPVSRSASPAQAPAPAAGRGSPPEAAAVAASRPPVDKPAGAADGTHRHDGADSAPRPQPHGTAADRFARRLGREAAAVLAQWLRHVAPRQAHHQKPSAQVSHAGRSGADRSIRDASAESAVSGSAARGFAPAAHGGKPSGTDASVRGDGDSTAARTAADATGGPGGAKAAHPSANAAAGKKETGDPSGAAAEVAQRRRRESHSRGSEVDSEPARDSRRQHGAVFDTPPRALPTNAPPSYPAESIAAGEQGRTVLKVAIDASGRVRSVSVQRSSGYPRLDAAALAAVRQWRFTPARRDARPVPCEVLVPVRFQIRPSSAAE